MIYTKEAKRREWCLYRKESFQKKKFLRVSSLFMKGYKNFFWWEHMGDNVLSKSIGQQKNIARKNFGQKRNVYRQKFIIG